MKLCIVTGASRGLGLSLARELGGESTTRVLAVSRTGLPADMLEWRHVTADLATDAGQDTACDAIVRALGEEAWTRAVLFNNAATLQPLGVVGRLSAADIRSAVALNLTATIVLMDVFLAHLGNVPSAAIVNISSGAGRRPILGSGIYSATKAGMDMISRGAALEAEQRGASVTITSLAPGIIDTEMQVTARSADEALFPSVGIFRGFKNDRLLKSPAEVAARILELERSGRLPSGIADVRELD